MERRESEGKGFAHLQGELTAADDVESGVEDREGSAIGGGRSGGDGGGDVGKGEIVFGGKTGEGLEGSGRRDAGAKEAAYEAVTIGEMGGEFIDVDTPGEQQSGGKGCAKNWQKPPGEIVNVEGRVERETFADNDVEDLGRQNRETHKKTGDKDVGREDAEIVKNFLGPGRIGRSEEHTSELQSQSNLVCRLLLE